MRSVCGSDESEEEGGGRRRQRQSSRATDAQPTFPEETDVQSPRNIFGRARVTKQAEQDSCRSPE